MSVASRFAAACNPLTLVSLSSPNWQQSRQLGVRYQQRGALQLDVYGPPRPSSLRPVIVFFYGGSWQHGSRQAYRFVASRLTRAGFVVVIPDYRLYPAAVFPDFVHDAAEAVSWVMDHATEFSGDPSQVFLMGHSAGAQIAALLHYESSYLSQSAASFAPAGLIGLAGPYDFLPLNSATLEAVFPEPLRAASQPVNVAHGDAAPALLIHGAADETVGPKNSRRLAAKVIAAQGAAQTIFYPKRGHVGVLLALARPFAALAPVVEDLCRFTRLQIEEN